MRLLLLLLLIASSLACQGAIQGDRGTNSSGSIDINVTLGLLARLSGISDVAFGNWSGGDLSANQNLCVGLYGTNTYRLRATGSGNGGDPTAFALTNGSAFIPYRVYFNDQTGVAGRNELIAGTTLNNQLAGSAFWNIFGCLNRNSNLSLLIQNSDLSASPTGTFAGVLTLTVIPE